MVLVTITVSLAQTRSEVRAIGDESAPLAATASDLYFALSDLDAQVARLVMINNASDLASNELDALLTYQRRSAEVDADIERILAAATSDTDRATARRMLDQLGLYRQLAWQALAVEQQEQSTAPGVLPPAALGYYTHATNVLHNELLPTAKLLRDSSQAALERSYQDQHTTANWGTTATLLLGGGLVALLIFVQIRLMARYRRLVNPLLLPATLITLGLVLSASFVLLDETDRLQTARSRHFTPYLQLTQAQAVSYDAAADTSRYLLSANLSNYDNDFHTKSDCLVKGGDCGGGNALPGWQSSSSGLTQAQRDEVVGRWAGYQRDHEKIIEQAQSNQAGLAIDQLTGLRRGDASFDFFYFDASVSDLAATRRQAFDAAMADARGELTGWGELAGLPVVPPVLMLAVMVLAAIGMWRRLAEYR